MAFTLRDRLTEVAHRFGQIEVALFTSFNFNGDFFEQNVLPALFGAEPGEPREAREQLVHKQLRHTRVGVFCDPSQVKASGKPFRYSLYPVFVANALFHPKNIVLIGRDAKGARWIYIAALSANLSLSGWGRNCEGFADTWVHALSEQPGQSLREFLKWVSTRVDGAGCDDALHEAIRLSAELMTNRCRADPENGSHESKRQDRLYFSVLNQSLWHFIRKEYKDIVKVRAASPYWGDATAIAAELQDVELELTAALMPPRMRVGLSRSTVQQLFGTEEENEIQFWESPEGRLFHLKLYELTTTQYGIVTGIGSCNFTCRGQFWHDAASGAQGNVETMLFKPGRFKWPPMRPLQHKDIPEEGVEEEAPPPWPFYVLVRYDWKTRKFSWTLQGEPGQAQVELTLPDKGTRLVLTASRPQGQRKGRLQGRLYSVHWNNMVFSGPVTEVNLDASDEKYGRPLATDSILESWRAGGVTEPAPGGDGDGDGDGDGGGDGDGDEDGDGEGRGGSEVKPSSSAAVFDLFLFYRGLKSVRAKIEATRGKPHDLLDWLVARTDSVVALAAAVRDSNVISAVKWIVHQECLAVLRSHEHLPQVATEIGRMLEAGKDLRTAVLAEISQELARRNMPRDAGRLLRWYEQQLQHGDRNEIVCQ